MNRRRIAWTITFWLVCALSLASLAAFAQQSSTAPLTPLPSGPPLAAAAPAQQPGYTLPPSQAAQALAYARARHELYFIDEVYSFVILLLLLRLRVAPYFRDLAERASGNSFAQAAIFSPLLLLTVEALSLPTDIWAHRLSLEYRQSIQGWLSWSADWAKGNVLDAAIAAPIVWILYAVIRKSARRWWFYFWLAAAPLIIVGTVAEPLIFEPMFYTFTPLADSHPQLAARMESVVQRAGVEIPENRIFLMNASSKLREVNAYATGLGATKRVVVWDTSIQRMTENEILFVFGHEMGHYVLGHVRDGILFACGLLLVFLFLAYRILRWMLAHWGGSWGIRGPGDLASLPALLLLALVFGFFFTPIDNAYSRHLEHQADQYGLELIHGLVPDAPVVAAHAFQVLGEVDLEEPDPSDAVKFWFYNHPPVDDRIRFALAYDPWGQGKSPQFVK